MDLWQWALVFAASASVLVVAGTVLATAGDEIGRRAGISGLVVGALLAALATSLPEIVTVVSAAVNDRPDLAVGNIFGSSMANMAILAVIDLVHRGRMIASVELSQARVAAIAILLTSVALLGIAGPTGGTAFGVSPYAIAIVVVYGVTVTWIRAVPYRFQLPGRRGGRLREGWRRLARARGPLLRFGAAAGLVLVAAPASVRAAEGITDTSGLSGSFVGVAFLAVATSLPELFTSLAAVRLGAYDLAVGNLLGSNTLNIASLFVADVFFRSGSLLGSVGRPEVVAGLVAVGLMGVAIAAIVGGGEGRVGPLEPGPTLLLLAYGAGLVLVYAT